MRLARAIGTVLAAFRRGEAGVAAVEFALIMPIMLLIYIGCAEASTLISMDRKVQNIANSVGDLVSRSDTEITTANLQDYVRIASGLMTPFDPKEIVQIVTQVQVLTNGNTSVVWSKGYRHQASVTTLAHKVGDPYKLPPEVINVAKGQYVIVSETVDSSYTPLFGIVFDKPVELYRRSFYMPRFGGKITLK